MTGSGNTPSPTPPIIIIPINVYTDEGHEVTIVSRGEDYGEQGFITVIDNEDKRYQIRFFQEDSGLTNQGKYTSEDFNPSELNGSITSVCIETENHANNWLILKWLKDYYGLNLSTESLYVLTNNGYSIGSECVIGCQNNLLTIGCTVSGSSFMGVIYDDANIGPDENKYINCSGKQTSAEPDMPNAVETAPLKVLTYDSEYWEQKCAALTTLILLVNGQIDYPIPLVE